MQNTILLKDNLTFDTVPDCHQMLVKHIKAIKDPTIIIDLQQVQQCDTAGLALIVESKRLVAAQQKKLTLMGVSESIRDLAKFYGVEVVLNDYK